MKLMARTSGFNWKFFFRILLAGRKNRREATFFKVKLTIYNFQAQPSTQRTRNLAKPFVEVLDKPTCAQCLKTTENVAFNFGIFNQSTFVNSHCKRSSLRSQWWMILFLWFSNPVPVRWGKKWKFSVKLSTLKVLQKNLSFFFTKYGDFSIQ